MGRYSRRVCVVAGWFGYSEGPGMLIGTEVGWFRRYLERVCLVA